MSLKPKMLAISRELILAVGLLTFPSRAPTVVAQTNNAGWAQISFRNAPIEAVARLVTVYTDKPVLVNQLVRETFTYRTNTATAGQALLAIAAELLAKGIILTNDDSYTRYRLIPVTQMDRFVAAPHIDIDIRAGSISVNERLVSLDRIAEIVKQQNPETEVWIHDPSDPFRPTQGDNTNLNYNSVLQRVKQANVGDNSIYRDFRRTDFLPKK